MFSYEFLLTDAWFVVCVLAALATFATAWLYLDAWLGRKQAKDACKWLGFGLLAGGFLLAGAQANPLSNSAHWFGLVGEAMRVLGYAFIAVGIALDPIQAKPGRTQNLTGSLTGGMAAGNAGGLMSGVVLSASSVLAAGLYWRMATTGLERHLRPVAWAMSWFAASELVAVSMNLFDVTDPRFEAIAGPFGWLWLLRFGILAIAAGLLLRWVWGYLVKRLQTQFFLVLTCGGIAVFLLSTISFTFLMMSKVQSEASHQLVTTAKVLQTAVSSRQAEMRADSRSLANDPVVLAAVTTGTTSALPAALRSQLIERSWSALTLTNADGRVVWRAHDPGRSGDSVSAQTNVALALVGKEPAGLERQTTGLEPSLMMVSTTPIRDSRQTIVGTVSVARALDNAFVDGLKQSSGLETAIYAGDVRVAATEQAAGGTGRQAGLKLTRNDISAAVLERGSNWSGTQDIGGRRYLAAYLPLRDAQNEIAGALFVGQTFASLVDTANATLQITFVITVLLLVIGIWPAHMISRALARQLQ